MQLPALGVDADIRLGELRRSALPAFPPDEGRKHPAVPPERGHRRLRRRLGADARLRLDEVAELQKLHVVVRCFLVLQGSLDAPARRQLCDAVRRPEEQRIRALAEAADENEVARFRLLQGGDHHDEGMGRPRLAADLVQVVDDRLLGRAQFLRDGAVLGLEETGEREPADVLHGKAGLLEESLHCLGDKFRVSLFTDPAFLPRIVETLAGAAVMVGEVVGNAEGAQEFGDDILTAHQDGSGPVPEPHLVEGTRPGFPPVGSGDEDVLPASRLDGIEGGDQSRRPGPQRSPEVCGGDVRLEVQRRRQDPRVLAVGEGRRRRAEVARVHTRLVLSRQTVPGCGDGHGERILVIIAHRTLSLRHHDSGRGEPSHGLVDGHAAQPQARDVGAV